MYKLSHQFQVVIWAIHEVRPSVDCKVNGRVNDCDDERSDHCSVLLFSWLYYSLL